MREKAGQTYREALVLMERGLWNGAANRVYYALYQAAVAAFERRGFKPADLGGVDPRHPDRWPHATVRRSARRLGLTRTDARLLEGAWNLRVQADYRDGDVRRVGLERTLVRARGLLRKLEVLP